MTKLMHKKQKIEQQEQKIGAQLRAMIDKISDVEQCLVVQALAHFPQEETISILLEQLRNPDVDVRCDCAKSLSILQDKRAIPILIENLVQDPVGEAKLLYVEALRSLKAYEAANILSILAYSRGEEENIIWEEDGSGWDDWLDVQLAAIKTLGELADKIDKEKAISSIITAMNDSDGQDVWPLAVKILVQFGQPGIRALTELIGAANSKNRRRIISALREAKDDLSKELIKAAMKDPDAGVREAAISSAARLNMHEIASLGLEDASINVRIRTLNEFDNISDEVLAIALDDYSPKVQRAACEIIIRQNKIRPKLDLISRAQKLLRKNDEQSQKTLSDFLLAISIARPKGAVEFIEDIATNNSTTGKVKLAAIRSLGELKSDNSISICAAACGSENFEIRLMAVNSLGKIAKTKGELGEKALDILISAIEGELVEVPEDWQAKNDNIIDFEEQRKLRVNDEELEQDEYKIRIDRDGNIIEESSDSEEPAGDNIKENIENEEEKEIRPPLSTLDAIMATSTIKAISQEKIKIEKEDIEFLEISGAQLIKRKRVNPIDRTPAHIDVRRLAALVGAETGRKELLEPLGNLLEQREEGLLSAAIEGLIKLAKAGIDISNYEKLLFRHATMGEKSLDYKAVRAIGYINTNLASKLLIKLAKEAKSDIVQSEAIKALRGRDVKIDLASLALKAGRLTRVAAANSLVDEASEIAVPTLVAFAFVENGVHQKIASDLLKQHKEHAFAVIEVLLDEEEGSKRLLALEMLNNLL